MIMSNQSISYSIAIDSGLFELKSDGYLRPKSNQEADIICSRLAKQSHQFNQIMVINANKPESNGLIVGGTTYTLETLSRLTDIPIENYYQFKNQFKNSAFSKITLKQWAEKRGIPSERIDECDISFGQYIKSDGVKSESLQGICFFYPQGVIHSISVNKINDKYIECWRPKGAKARLIPFWKCSNKNRINPDDETLYITEGEKDALCLGQWGFETVALPSASNRIKREQLQWIKVNYPDIKRIRFVFDFDKAGYVGVRKNIAVFAKEENLIVEMLKWPEGTPLKTDVTDLSKKHGETFVKTFLAMDFISVWREQANEVLTEDEVSDDYKDLDKVPISELAKAFEGKWIVAQGTDFRGVWEKHSDGYYIKIADEDQIRNVAKHYPTFEITKVKRIQEYILKHSKKFDYYEIMQNEIILFTNGVIDLDSESSSYGKFRKYKNGEIILDPVWKYNSELGESELLSRTLKEWFPKASEDELDFIKELMAYFALVAHKKYQVWLNSYGVGSNGKSVFLDIISRIVGVKNVASMDFGECNRFTTSAFIGKRIIMGKDSSEYIENTSLIKQLTGEDSIKVEFKGGGIVDVENTWKVLVSTNEAVRSKDTSDGWFRRIIVLPFMEKFKVNPKFRETILRDEEILKIINMLIPYAIDLEQRGELLPMPNFCEAIKEEVQSFNNPILVWWLSLLESDKLDDWQVSEAYAVFKIWFGENYPNAKTVSLTKFGGEMGQLMRVAKAEGYNFVSRKNVKYIVKMNNSTRKSPDLFLED